MTLVAAIPVSFIALLKWHVDRFKTTAQIIALHGSIEDIPDTHAPLAKFEHTLLKKDWMPEFRLMPQDKEEYEKAKEDPVFGKTLKGLLYGNSSSKRKKHHKNLLEKYRSLRSRSRSKGDEKERGRSRHGKGEERGHSKDREDRESSEKRKPKRKTSDQNRDQYEYNEKG